MAASFVSIKNHHHVQMPDNTDHIENQYSTVPSDRDAEFDVELGVLMMNGL